MTAGGARPQHLVWAGIAGACLPLSIALCTPSSAFGETRGYVISMIHTATYADTDTCPAGGNGGPVEFRTRRLVSAGFSEEEALAIVANGGRDEDGNRVDVSALFGSNAAAGDDGWNGYAVTSRHSSGATPRRETTVERVRGQSGEPHLGTRPARSNRTGAVRVWLQSRWSHWP